MGKRVDGDRRARYAVSAVFFVDGAALGGYVSHLADIQAKLHLSNGGLGRAILFSALGAITTMPLAGSLIHRVGSRALTLAGASVLLCVLPFIMLAPSVPLLCATLYLVGLSNGQADVAMNTHSMAVQDRFSRPILSSIHGWFSLGGFAGGGGAALAARLGGTPLQHLIAASLILAVIFAVSVSGFLPWETDKDADPPKLALPSRRIMFLGVLVLFAFVIEGSMWDWSSVYLRRVLLSGAELGALGFGFSSFGMALGRFLGDGWAHRFGFTRVLAASGLVAGAGLMLAVNVNSLWLAIAGFSLLGVGVANMTPMLFRAAANQPGISAGAGLSAVTTCGYTAFLGGPPLLGYIADRRTLGFALGLIALLCLAVAATSRQAVGVLDRRSDARTASG